MTCHNDPSEHFQTRLNGYVPMLQTEGGRALRAESAGLTDCFDRGGGGDDASVRGLALTFRTI